MEFFQMNAADLYRYLSSNNPEGKVMIEGKEKEDFMRRHGIGQYR